MSEIIPRIKRLIKVYTSWYGDNIRVVIKQAAYDKLMKELKGEDIKEIISCDVEIYDKISADFYVTSKIDDN